MVNAIVHTAVARKMLCSPVNSLIADTEFACAAGMMLRLIKAGETDKQRAVAFSTMEELSRWLLGTYERELGGEFDTPCKNLIEMVRNYRAEDHPFTEQLRELFILGCEQEIIYPKGRFL